MADEFVLDPEQVRAAEKRKAAAEADRGETPEKVKATEPTEPVKSRKQTTR